LASDQTVQFSSTWNEFGEYFKDYDRTPLGTYVYNQKFSNGVESKAIVGIFPKIAFIQTSISKSPCMTREQFEQFVKEADANADYVVNEAAGKAGIDYDKAKTLFSSSTGILVLFEPKVPV
jgi:hypothetical protein